MSEQVVCEQVVCEQFVCGQVVVTSFNESCV